MNNIMLLPYNRKYWRSYNLAVRPQTKCKQILVEFKFDIGPEHYLIVMRCNKRAIIILADFSLVVSTLTAKTAKFLIPVKRFSGYKVSYLCFAFTSRMIVKRRSIVFVRLTHVSRYRWESLQSVQRKEFQLNLLQFISDVSVHQTINIRIKLK